MMEQHGKNTMRTILHTKMCLLSLLITLAMAGLEQITEFQNLMALQRGQNIMK